MGLRDEIEAANRRAGIGRQHAFAKKQVVRQSDTQIIDMLCARANEVGTAFYKEDAPALRDAVKNLLRAVVIAGKRMQQ